MGGMEKAEIFRHLRGRGGLICFKGRLGCARQDGARPFVGPALLSAWSAERSCNGVFVMQQGFVSAAPEGLEMLHSPRESVATMWFSQQRFAQ